MFSLRVRLCGWGWRLCCERDPPDPYCVDFELSRLPSVEGIVELADGVLC